jgi:DNA-binding NarL/FixJ family response regulator
MTEASMSVRRVLVADDQALVRVGIVALLGGLTGFRCVGCVDSGAAALAACSDDPPDVLLLDIRMPGLDGFAVAEEVHRRHPQTAVVFLSAQDDPALVRRAVDAGVLGFISKDSVLDELAHALASVAAGRRYLSPHLAVAALQRPAAAGGTPLSPRQQEILRRIAQGSSNKEMARELGLSVKTVEFHRTALIQRLDLHDVASLTRYAVQHGLVD